MGVPDEHKRRGSDATAITAKRRRGRTTDDDLDATLARLERDVIGLDEETGRLEGKIMALARIPWQSVRLHDQRSSRVIDAYLQVFRHGFKVKSAVDAIQQERFLRSICREDMVFSGDKWATHGVNKLIYAFRMYSSSHSNYTMHAQSVEVIRNDEDNGDVVCDVQCTVSQRLTRDTLAAFFPHIINHERLVQTLIGRDVLVDTKVTFGFTAAGLVDAYSVSMSRETAFAQLIGIEEAAILIDGHKYSTLVEVG